MAEQTKQRTAWALEVLNDADGSYQEMCLWQILNWCYWREVQKAKPPTVEDAHGEPLNYRPRCTASFT